jgi:glyoxylase-like metal-dependent hydrolase (beta-lactamase superfamily II)
MGEMPFLRHRFEGFEIVAVQAWPDQVMKASDLFPDVEPAAWEEERLREPRYFVGADQVKLTQTIIVVLIDGQIVLIDTSTPIDLEDALLLSGLAEAGISPEQVTHVVLTHRDLDHVGGGVVDGKPVYPNARYIMGRTEFEDYQNDFERRHFGTYVAPLLSAGILDVCGDDEEILPGIRFVFTPGHRSGATSVLVRDQFLCLADTWHVAAQVTHPEWAIKWDSDPVLAAETREKVVRMAEENGWVVASPHTPFFGLGRVVVRDGVRVWEPLLDMVDAV